MLVLCEYFKLLNISSKSPSMFNLAVIRTLEEGNNQIYRARVQMMIVLLQDVGGNTQVISMFLLSPRFCVIGILFVCYMRP